MLLADGGLDFNPSHIANDLFYYLFFKQLDADVLAVMTWAACYPAFNPIKHCWSPLSNKLSSVILSPIENEDDVSAPVLQSGLSKEDLKIKDKIVFDRAMNSLSKYNWKDFKYDGLVPREHSTDLSWGWRLVVQLLWSCACLLKWPIRDLRKYSDLLLELIQMHGHIDRHFVFVKCENRSCCNEFRSKVGKEILGAERRLPSPAPNRNSKGHYNTFIQEVFNEEKIFGDEVQPTAMEKNLGRCDFCSNFSFKPATNKTSKHIPSLAKTKGWQRMQVLLSLCKLPVSFASQPSINVIVQEICPYSCRRSLLNAKVIKRSFYLKVWWFA